MGFFDDTKCSVCGVFCYNLPRPEGVSLEITKWFDRCWEHIKCEKCGEWKEPYYVTEKGLFCEECHKKVFDEVIKNFKPDAKCNYTSEVVCAWCGYEFSDSWEYSDYDEVECPDCFRKSEFSRIVYCDYISTRKEDEKDENSKG